MNAYKNGVGTTTMTCPTNQTQGGSKRSCPIKGSVLERGLAGKGSPGKATKPRGSMIPPGVRGGESGKDDYFYNLGRIAKWEHNVKCLQRGAVGQLGGKTTEGNQGGAIF